jgi:hypothetical protein
MSKDLVQEKLRPFTLRRRKENVGRRDFYDFGLVHEDHCVSDRPGETHFVDYDDHGHALLGEATRIHSVRSDHV